MSVGLNVYLDLTGTFFDTCGHTKIRMYLQSIDGVPCFCISPGLSSTSYGAFYYYPDYPLSTKIKRIVAYYFTHFYSDYDTAVSSFNAISVTPVKDEKGNTVHDAEDKIMYTATTATQGDFQKYTVAQIAVWTAVLGGDGDDFSEMTSKIFEYFGISGSYPASTYTSMLSYSIPSDMDFEVYRSYDSSDYQYLVTANVEPQYTNPKIALTKACTADEDDVTSFKGALYGVYTSETKATNALTDSSVTAVCYFITSADGTGYVARSFSYSGDTDDLADYVSEQYGTTLYSTSKYGGKYWCRDTSYSTTYKLDSDDGGKTYYAVELLVPNNGDYIQNTTVKSKYVSTSGTFTFTVYDKLKPVISLKKTIDPDEDIDEDDDELASFKGALYGIYTSKADAKAAVSDSSIEAVCYFVTSASGTGYVAKSTSYSGNDIYTYKGTKTYTTKTYGGKYWYSTGDTSFMLDSTGTYYAVELLAPNSGAYELNSAVKNKTVKVNGSYTFTMYDTLVDSGTLSIVKAGETSKTSTPSLSGALFGVYTSKSDAKTAAAIAAGTDTTSSVPTAVCYFITYKGTGYIATTTARSTSYTAEWNGETYYKTTSTSVELDDGTYYIAELIAPSCGKYILNTDITEAAVVAGEDTEAEITNYEYSYLKLEKVNTVIGGYAKSLKGALFGVYTSKSDAKTAAAIAAGTDTTSSVPEAVGYFMTDTGTTSATGCVATTDKSSDEVAATDYYAVWNGKTYYKTSTVSLYVEQDTYYAVELVAPYTGGYMLSSDILTVTADEYGGTFTFEAEDNGWVNVFVSKSSSVTGDYVLNNNAYSLKGAVYRVYTDSSCTTRAKDKDGNSISLTTDEDGNTGTAALAFGSVYYVKEYSASPGYQLDETVYTLDLSELPDDAYLSNSEYYYKIESVEVPANDPAQIYVDKVNEDGEDCGGIEGAIIEAVYSWTDNDGDKQSLTNYYISDSAGYIDISDLSYVCNASGTVSTEYNNFPVDDDTNQILLDAETLIDDDADQILLYAGTLTVTEYKAPTGYVKSDEEFVFTYTVTGSATSGYSLTASPESENIIYNSTDDQYEITLYDPTIRGGVELTKVDEDAYNTNQSATKTQGDATLEGAQIAIINNGSSANANKNGAVYMTEDDVEESDYIEFVEDENGDGWYEVGETMLILTTYKYNGEIIATTDGNHDGECYTLPYGTYIAQEETGGASEGYLDNTTWSAAFIIFSIVHCSYTEHYHFGPTTYKKSLLFLCKA